MIKIREAIVVEGRYDKNTLSQIVDAPIFETSGFGIFNDKEKMNLLRRVAEKRGLIVFTDSDGAGFVIRNRIKGAIPPAYLKHAYIPEIAGKEKRKARPGKEGILGVEGMDGNTLIDCLQRAGATMEGNCESRIPSLNKQDMVSLGLSGCADSSRLRKRLCRHLGFPEKSSANDLLQALNVLYNYQELEAVIESMERENG